MDSYSHNLNRSIGLLQRAYMLRSAPFAVTTPYEKLKSTSNQSNAYPSSSEFQQNNDSYYDTELFKGRIFSPTDTVISRYDTPTKSRYHKEHYPLSRSQSFTKTLPTKAKKTLLLDLDETLVHSSFRPFSVRADIELQVVLDGVKHHIYAMKRPFVDQFLRRMSELYDLFIFTASISQYANPLLDKLDPHRLIKHRLFRGDCLYRNEGYIKDLSVVNRDFKDMILLDNNPISYWVNQLNGMPILTWHDDKADEELSKLVPLLEYMSSVEDVRRVIGKVVYNERVDYTQVNKLLQANGGAYTQIKAIKASNPSLSRSKSSTALCPYDKKLQEWNEIKEKIVKSLEESSNYPTSTKYDLYYSENNDNYQPYLLNRSYQKPFSNLEQYILDKRSKYIEEAKDDYMSIKENYDTHKLISFTPSKHHSLERDILLSQTSASSFYHKKQIENRPLKRTSSCKCFRAEDNDFSPSHFRGDSNPGLDEPNRFKSINRTSSKNNSLNFYEPEVEEEKSSYKPQTDSKLYASWPSQRNFHNRTPQKAADHCYTNYHTTLKRTMSRKGKEERMLTPGFNRYGKEKAKKTSLASAKKRLLFNTSTIGNVFSFLPGNSDTNYITQRFSLREKESNVKGSYNQFFS